ncbi:isochorismatase family protein [Nostoc sp. TCL26-01]|uniref:isochorismatase family protein n=1 Tax=Nostoc sp. TCL26-01 TaxID=2576904 RepID=UPI0015BF646F|nr:isochorismatase family protein [Nostoc sp. TCL26-01]QLE55608.1 isochorismatase family protein [Nostoc sp. TCL26-01]
MSNNRFLEKLAPDNAVFLPIDYMHGLMSACRSIDPGLLKNNAIALAKIARLFQLPTIGTGDREGMSYLGAEIPELPEILPDMEFVPRSQVGAWDVPQYVDLVRSTGRKKLILAGITTEQCVTFTAQGALADGFDVYVVLDASASLDTRAEQTAIARLTQMGAILTTWSPLGAELLHDFAYPEGAGLIEIYAEHQADLRTVQDNYNTARRHATERDRSATKL